MRDPNCTLCGLHETAQHVCLLGTGPIPCKVMIVGEAPGKREDDSGKAFVNPRGAGGVLDEMLRMIDVHRSEVFITNAVSCRPPKNRTPTKPEIRACNVWLQKQIDAVKPEFILALGNVPCQALLGKTGITKLRGKPIEREDGITVFPTFHPAAVKYDEGKKSALESDFKAFEKLVAGEEEESEFNTVVVDDWDKVDQMIDDLRGEVSFDIETSGLNPWQEHVWDRDK